MNTRNTPAWQVRVVLDGVRVPPYQYSVNKTLKIAHVDLVDRNSLNRYFERGATVMLDDAQTAMPMVTDLCAQLTGHAGVPTACTIFASPPHADGFALHQDAEDVVIVQLAGAKRWTVFAPLCRRESSMLNRSECAEPLLDTELHAGDILVLPKGSPHKTSSNSRDGSVHMTLGFYPVTLRDALVRLIAQSEDVRLDGPVPKSTKAVLEIFHALASEAGRLPAEADAILEPLMTRLRGDTHEFRLMSSEAQAEGGSYRLLTKVTNATRLFLAAQLGRPHDEQLETLVASLSGRKPGEVFTQKEFATAADDPILIQEVLHAMLRMRFIAHA